MNINEMFYLLKAAWLSFNKSQSYGDIIDLYDSYSAVIHMWEDNRHAGYMPIIYLRRKLYAMSISARSRYWSMGNKHTLHNMYA